MPEVPVRRFPDDPQSDWSHVTQPGDLPELLERGIEHSLERAESLNRELGGDLDILSRDCQSEEKLNCLVIGERFQAALQKALPQSLAMAVIVRSLHLFVLSPVIKVSASPPGVRSCALPIEALV